MVAHWVLKCAFARILWKTSLLLGVMPLASAASSQSMDVVFPTMIQQHNDTEIVFIIDEASTVMYGWVNHRVSAESQNTFERRHSQANIQD